MVTNRNKWEETVGEFILTERNKREDREKREKSKKIKIFGITASAIIFIVIIFSGMLWGQKELELAEYKESDIVAEEKIASEVGEEIEQTTEEVLE